MLMKILKRHHTFVLTAALLLEWLNVIRDLVWRIRRIRLKNIPDLLVAAILLPYGAFAIHQSLPNFLRWTAGNFDSVIIGSAAIPFLLALPGSILYVRQLRDDATNGWAGYVLFTESNRKRAVRFAALLRAFLIVSPLVILLSAVIAATMAQQSSGLILVPMVSALLGICVGMVIGEFGGMSSQGRTKTGSVKTNRTTLWGHVLTRFDRAVPTGMIMWSLGEPVTKLRLWMALVFAAVGALLAFGLALNTETQIPLIVVQLLFSQIIFASALDYGRQVRSPILVVSGLSFLHTLAAISRLPFVASLSYFAVVAVVILAAAPQLWAVMILIGVLQILASLMPLIVASAYPGKELSQSIAYVTLCLLPAALFQAFGQLAFLIVPIALVFLFRKGRQIFYGRASCY